VKPGLHLARSRVESWWFLTVQRLQMLRLWRLAEVKLLRGMLAVGLLMLVAIGVTFASGIRSAQADLSSLTLSANNAVFGQTVTINGVVTNVANSLVTLKVNSGTFTAASVSTGEPLTGSGTASLSFTGAAASSGSTISATYQCNSNVAVTFTLQQFSSTAQAGPAFLQQSLTCSATGQPQLGCQQYSLNFSPTNASNAPCQSACPYQNANLLGPAMGPCSYPYPAQSQWLNSCPFPYSNPASNNYYYQNNPPNPFPSYSYPYNSGICSTPVALTLVTPAVADQVTLAFSKSQQGCDQSNVLSVEVRDKSGNMMPDGTVVSAASRLGTIDPGQSYTSAGIAYFVYIGPASGGGTDVVTATAGMAKSSTNLEVICTGVTSGALPAVPPPASVPLAQAPLGQPSLQPLSIVPGGTPRITPPSTGDAGLRARLGPSGPSSGW